MSSVPKRRSVIGKIEYDPDPERVVAGLISLLTYRSPAEPSAPSKPPAATSKPRARKPSPSRLAKWEAAWQAEQDAEAES
jgi:hypothetical protein